MSHPANVSKLHLTSTCGYQENYDLSFIFPAELTKEKTVSFLRFFSNFFCGGEAWGEIGKMIQCDDPLNSCGTP